jgi:hypothetical protein
VYHQVWHLEILSSAHTVYLLVPYQLLFSLSLFNEGLPIITFLSRETNTYKKLNETNRQLVQRASYSSIDDYQTKIPTIYQETF